MSSFRVKTTSKLLDPNATMTVGGKSRSFMDMLEDEDNDSTFMSFLTEIRNQFTNRPKGDSSGGIAIREVKSAMSDHM